jgi:excisionase family DNA binding protein
MRSYSPMSEVLAHTIADATKISGIGRTTLYEAIGAGKIEARKAGSRTLIVAESLRAFLNSLPAADIRTGQNKAAA